MKKFVILLLITSTLCFYSCSKDFIKVDATVEKNCTGSYLKIDNKFYYVCNADKITSYNTGQAISVTYEVLEGCKAKSEVNACELLFSYEAIIEIKAII